MKRSEAVDQIATALSKAQADMKNPTFDAQNPHFKNRYASLAAVRDAVLPALSKHGISCHQDLVNVDGGVSSTLLLLHTSGQWIEFGPLSMPSSKHDAQGLGSSGTYCRRYQMMAVAGVVGDADDDAEAAVGRGNLPRIDPRGEEHTKQDMKKANEYAVRFKQAVADGNEALCYELHQELNGNADFYIAVSTCLSAAERRTIKDAIHRVHEERKSANGARTQ